MDGSAPEMAKLLSMVHSRGASDLHIKVGNHPIVRINGKLERVTELPVLDVASARTLVEGLMTEEQRQTFRSHLELDFAYSMPGVSRFRVNVYQQRGSIGAAIRAIPAGVPELEALGLPPVVKRFCSLPRGLVLVTGPTGSGKSTTLAAMIHHINQTRSEHVVTIEDPIEYLHRDQMCVVNQREVGMDTHSFADALRHVLRQDPDVILIGEMRDLETIATAVTAAETGHLVFATLHTQSAPATVDRIVDVFPPHQQAQIRTQLAGVLEGVLCQTLIPRADGKGRVAAIEVMMATAAIRNLIREGKTHQMPSLILAGAKDGMQTLNQALRQLVEHRHITYEAALAKTPNDKEFAQLMGKAVSA